MHRTFRWLLLSLAVVGLAADQSSKYLVFRWLYNSGPLDSTNSNSFEVVPGHFKLIAQFNPNRQFCDCGFSCLQSWSAPVMPHVNQGALFGMFGDHRSTANGVFAAVSVLAAIGILAWGLRRNTAREPWLMGSLGLILAGTIGNFYDRIVFNGVRDFLYLYDPINYPVFNIADCCLVVGAILLFFQAVWMKPADEKPAEAQATVVPEAPKA
jgi:lipoprotein signal peptidase